jgi:hypothetical protein
VWIIILALLLLLLACPVGADAAKTADAFFLKLKIGPLRKTLLPKEKKNRKKKEKKEAAPKAEEPQQKKEKKKKKLSLTLDDILTLAEIALDTLHRFRVHLSVDQIMLHWIAAASDPYDAVMQYGKLNAALGVLQAKAHTALKVRDEDIRTELDLTASRPQIEGRIILTIQIWEILLIGICAGAKGLRWFLKKKRSARAAAAAETERSTSDGEL